MGSGCACCVFLQSCFVKYNLQPLLKRFKGGFFFWVLFV
jgi:hypothetical protein